MDELSRQKGETNSQSPKEGAPFAAPTISLPKGGGAIRGIGEKFAANPVTGTGSMTVPIATSPGRSGFGPQLSLSYDSGAGNGPFGLGWNLSLPSITRKTDKGLPKYQDADESDVFILSGAEDLVPEFEKDATGEWVIKDGKHVIHDKPRTVDGVTYAVRRYRPRIEGLFARIERWTNQIKPEDTFWRSISKDNITTIYGRTAESQIVDPVDPTRIFSWLICESYDDKGNVIVYHYKAENSDKVDQSHAHERNRTDDTRDTDKANRTANRYLKRIHYGNRTPFFSELKENTPWPEPPGPVALGGTPNWFFEVVFDYEEGHYAEDPPDPEGRIFARPTLSPPANVQWTPRVDPFSSYRAGFEIRTYRLCQRVLMCHHFPTELGTPDCLVRSTDFTYSYETNPQDARNPIFSFLDSVSQSGYVRQANGSYLKKSLPPLQFAYTKAEVQEEVREVDPRSLENLPYGLDGSHYQWVDLDGEGVSGFLTEQADSWFYKRNLSPLPIETNGKEELAARFAPVELIAKKPSLAAISAGGQQLLDLAGDGQLDLVALSGPTPGFYERTHDEGWEPFKPFRSLPNVEWNNPNLKFVDLTGDGHADVLVTEDEVFCWYPSLAEEGFGPVERVPQNWDEEKGPRLVFADAEHSIHLADLSGDGLSDLVRIRNGEVCYWPNLGYGRFSAKVTMDNAPWFDNPDLFDPRRIQLADIDGSGTTDIIYLRGNGVALYFNQSGNSWSKPLLLNNFPQIDNLSSVTALDLLGNGTACLVWSSPLPGNGRRPMRYIDLMGGQKPHLLIKTVNNLGAETHVQYAPSTKFYLQDKLAGKPWITKLPFPVHCVEKVTVTDKWRETTFSSTYSYHHGYFDGVEREFRGFGRVEQLDTESYGEFARGNIASPYITDDKTLYQPPVKTVTWYHTGAALDREHILFQFKHEYFPRWFEELRPGEINVLGTFQEHILPEPDLVAADLGTEEWREALRACKGMMLRQEVYELDVDALERPDNPEHRPVKLYSTAYHNCHIQRLQPQADNPHAVFLVAESEAITYHYELDLTTKDVRPDPRIAHTLNLQYDEYANVLQSVAVVYPRLGKFEDDANLADGLTDALSLIRQAQKEETHVAYSETRYTEDFGTKLADKVAALDNHRLRVPCEVLTYELTGIKPQSGLHFTLNELHAFQLSPVHQKSGTPVLDIPYHQIPSRATPTPPEKRLVEHARTLFFTENLVDSLPFGEHGRLGLTYEAYKLALTKALLDAIFKDVAGNNKLDQPIDGATTARAKLNDPASSGYLSGAKLVTRFASIPATELTGQYWIRSGIAGFEPDAAQRFYLPEQYTDPFDNITRLKYDARDLFIQSSTDMLGNTTGVLDFNYRVLAPSKLIDINDNETEAYFDILGMVVASAVKGKGSEADDLSGFDDALANPSPAAVQKFCTESEMNEQTARDWLGRATARFVYHFGEGRDANGNFTGWAARPAGACGIQREIHFNAPGGANSPLQVALECSDGAGNVLMKKVQAEPVPGQTALRWIINGLTVLNNKGKPVKQYEPAFSEVGFGCEPPPAKGVTPIIYYDAAGRLVRTEMPDGTFSRVEFSPWHMHTFDQNDTAYDPDEQNHSDWYKRRTDPTHPLFAEFSTVEERRAAELVKDHANTAALTILDSLGREVIAIAHNKYTDAAGNVKDEKYTTFTKLDAEGKPLWIRDARGNLVMQYITPAKANNDPSNAMPASAVPCYDIAGNLLFQHSMDAGDRWMLNDAAGKPMFAWDSRDNVFMSSYDPLHRPTKLELKNLDHPGGIVVGLTQYGEGTTGDQANNRRGKPYRSFDQSGVVTNQEFDFKGNALSVSRRLANDYDVDTDWKAVLQLPFDQEPGSLLMLETFTQITEYDALNRMTRQYNWHRADKPVAVYEPGYNERGLLVSEDLTVGASMTATGQGKTTRAIKSIAYDAKGQRSSIIYGNDVTTDYTYDANTFRLLTLVSTRPNKPTRPNETGLQDLSYTYDPSGNITEIFDAAVPTEYFNNAVIEPRKRYVYDALYRLIEATGREHAGQLNHGDMDNWNDCPYRVEYGANNSKAWRKYTQRYTYDSVGNILVMEHILASSTNRWTRQYQYATDSNRLLATGMGAATVNHYVTSPTLEYRYPYNVHGSITSLPHLPTMDWDYTDHLHHISRSPASQGTDPDDCPNSSLEAWYRYDATKQRTRKRVKKQGGLVEERFYLGGLEWYRRTLNGTLVEEIETLHLFDGEHRLLMVDQVIETNRPALGKHNLSRYTLSNHLGSSTVEVDENADIISYEEYHPYGTTAYQSGRNAAEVKLKRYRYTGMERDEESGLGYHGARYYAPQFGRWVSCDPNWISDGPNVYEFVVSNPINFADPNGRNAVPKEYLALPSNLRQQLENPPTLLPMRQPSLAHQGPVLTQGVPLNPKWDTAEYQRENAEQMYYATRPLEALARSGKKQQEEDLVRFVSNFGVGKNYPGYRGPTALPPRQSGAPTHSPLYPLGKTGAGESKPVPPTMRNGFTPQPSENFTPVVNPPLDRKAAPPEPTPKLLPGGGSTTKTLRQVRNTKGTNPERGAAGKEFVRELNQASGEKASNTKIGKRQDDVSYDTQRTTTEFRHEAKNFRVWITGPDGVPLLNAVPLRPELREQADKNFLWRREGLRLGEDRVVQWDFVGAPPSAELAQYLQLRKIPYVTYQQNDK